MQNELFAALQQDCFISILETGHRATRFLAKHLPNSNITRLVQYGRINKISHDVFRQFQKRTVALLSVAFRQIASGSGIDTRWKIELDAAF